MKKTKSAKFERCFIRSEDVEYKRVLDELLVLDPKTFSFFRLNGTAARVWELLDGSNDFDAIVAKLCSEFDVDKKKAELDLKPLLAKLRKNCLIK